MNNHEGGSRHKEAVRIYMQDMRDKKAEARKAKKTTARELERINKVRVALHASALTSPPYAPVTPRGHPQAGVHAPLTRTRTLGQAAQAAVREDLEAYGDRYSQPKRQAPPPPPRPNRPAPPPGRPAAQSSQPPLPPLPFAPAPPAERQRSGDDAQYYVKGQVYLEGPCDARVMPV